MVVKSIFLILNISHSSFANNHNISDPPAEGGGRGRGVLPGPWSHLGPAWSPPNIVLVTRRTNLNNIIQTDKYSPAAIITSIISTD